MATTPESDKPSSPDVPDLCGPAADNASQSVLAEERSVAPSGTDTEVVVPSVIEVRDLDWAAIREATHPAAVRARMRLVVEQMEAQSIVSEPGHNGNREVLAPPPNSF